MFSFQCAHVQHVFKIANKQPNVSLLIGRIRTSKGTLTVFTCLVPSVHNTEKHPGFFGEKSKKIQTSKREQQQIIDQLQICFRAGAVYQNSDELHL